MVLTPDDVIVKAISTTFEQLRLAILPVSRLPLTDIELTYLEDNLAFLTFSKRLKITERGTLALLLADKELCLILIVAFFIIDEFFDVDSS